MVSPTLPASAPRHLASECGPYVLNVEREPKAIFVRCVEAELTDKCCRSYCWSDMTGRLKAPGQVWHNFGNKAARVECLGGRQNLHLELHAAVIVAEGLLVLLDGLHPRRRGGQRHVLADPAERLRTGSGGQQRKLKGIDEMTEKKICSEVIILSQSSTLTEEKLMRPG